ncbi:intradiol ring-cleavage dioxygenase [Aquihabitans sp. G128]|uniref:intradiol ring-cleavage dioxygenase n=1 Tax=Aquihabitans sp. G128 TaxID=2849779 RepID=UPI001C220243|nr:intradiol ring-cleavage dioxygenase [Aquihabitans sp. G128]QXC59097.1 intradiol ring-cleavage dioxygenase [Aquihabitans sp. G128]
MDPFEHHPDEHDDEHDLGLQHDLATMERLGALAPVGAPAATGLAGLADGLDVAKAKRMDRRRALTMIGGGGAAALVLAACKIPVTGGGYAVTPTETAGPYPGDGSNGPDVLSTSGVVRRDIRSSFGSLSGTAAGVPLTIELKVTDVSRGNVVKPGAAVYLWHCNRDGKYSLYSSGVTNQNYLRGVQAADADGNVTFTSIFPAAYDGRWPHIHFEVYESLATAKSVSNKVLTSQMALPKAACDTVYATSGYGASKANLAKTSLATDMVFRDGYSHELATVTGSTSAGYTAKLTIAVP